MGWCYCNRVCSVGNCARLLHLSLTLFVFYVLLVAPSSELHEAWEHKSSKFLTIVSLVVLSTLTFLAASLTDPGYEPLSVHTEPHTSLFTLSHAKKYMPKEGGAYDSSDSEKQLDCDTVSGQWKCRNCDIVVQLRSKHCKICQRCVRKFDHHCPWLGNCVGERNHRFFWMFLGLETIVVTWGIIMSWNALLTANSLVSWVRLNILTVTCLLLVFFGCIASSMLFLFHTYLMVSGQTTWEMASRLKISYLRDLDPPINPFDEGLCRNVCRFLCVFGTRNWDVVYSRTVEKMEQLTVP